MSDETTAPTDSAHFPKMLYRPGTEMVLGAHSADTLIVNGDDEFDDAADNGWLTVDDFLETDPLLGFHADVSAQAMISADVDLIADLTTRATDAEAALATANGTISTLRTEVSLANDRIVTLEETIATLQAQNAELAEKLAALDKPVGNNPGGSLQQDPPSLSGKTKAELLAIAADEKVEVEDNALNADIIAAIELKREAGAA